MPDPLPPHSTDTPPPPANGPSHERLQHPGTRPRYISEQLFGEYTEVEIQHGESTYRLRLTSLGKLILTK